MTEQTGLELDSTDAVTVVRKTPCTTWDVYWCLATSTNMFEQTLNYTSIDPKQFQNDSFGPSQNRFLGTPYQDTFCWRLGG